MTPPSRGCAAREVPAPGGCPTPGWSASPGPGRRGTLEQRSAAVLPSGVGGGEVVRSGGRGRQSRTTPLGTHIGETLTQRLIRAVLFTCAIGAPTHLMGQAPSCQFRGTEDALAERSSPLDSVTVSLGTFTGKLCYGRPTVRGRAMIGGQLPYGMPWEMGANEPTTLHLPFPARVGSVDLDPGTFSLYAIPGEGDWTIVVNGNPDRWGVPISARPSVRLTSVASPCHPRYALSTSRRSRSRSGEPMTRAAPWCMSGSGSPSRYPSAAAEGLGGAQPVPSACACSTPVSRRMNVAPCPGAASTSTLPPCASATPLTIANPSPAPPPEEFA